MAKRLTFQEMERLALLQEAAGEVVKWSAWAMREGYEASPRQEPECTYDDILEVSIGQLMYSCALLFAAGDLDNAACLICAKEQATTVREDLRFQEKALLDLVDETCPVPNQQTEH